MRSDGRDASVHSTRRTRGRHRHQARTATTGAWRRCSAQSVRVEEAAPADRSRATTPDEASTRPPIRMPPSETRPELPSRPDGPSSATGMRRTWPRRVTGAVGVGGRPARRRGRRRGDDGRRGLGELVRAAPRAPGEGSASRHEAEGARAGRRRSRRCRHGRPDAHTGPSAPGRRWDPDRRGHLPRPRSGRGGRAAHPDA